MTYRLEFRIANLNLRRGPGTTVDLCQSPRPPGRRMLAASCQSDVLLRTPRATAFLILFLWLAAPPPPRAENR